ncbi:MAG: cysteine peptidase family C39 domain-containing protein [Candidatus Sericytochromatia bacterium]
MNPLLLPTLIVALLSFLAGIRLARLELSGPGLGALICLGILLGLPAMLFAAYYLHVYLDNARWFFDFRTLPYTELLAGGIGLLAGIAHERFLALLPRRSVVTGALFPVLTLGLIGVPYSKMLLSPLETRFLYNRWEDGICFQSTSSTCGPCNVATFLRLHGFKMSETEVAQAAYTSARGTEAWYLARILHSKGLQTEFIFDPPQSEPLRYPAIAGVKLENPAGIGHFIAIFARNKAGYEIADPLLGRLTLTPAQLAQKYYFTGFFLLVKNPANQTSLSAAGRTGIFG